MKANNHKKIISFNNNKKVNLKNKQSSSFFGNTKTKNNFIKKQNNKNGK